MSPAPDMEAARKETGRAGIKDFRRGAGILTAGGLDVNATRCRVCRTFPSPQAILEDYQFRAAWSSRGPIALRVESFLRV